MTTTAPQTRTDLDTMPEKNIRSSQVQPVALGFQVFLRSLFLVGTIFLLVVTIVDGLNKDGIYVATLVPFCLSMLGDPYEFAVLMSHKIDKRILRRVPMPIVILYDTIMLTATSTAAAFSYRDLHDKSFGPSGSFVTSTYILHGKPETRMIAYQYDYVPGVDAAILLTVLSMIRTAMLIMAVVDTVRWAGLVYDRKITKPQGEEAAMTNYN